MDVSTYIGSRHILLLQLLQGQHLRTAGVVGVGDPGVVRQVHVTVQAEINIIFN